jgi:hypothetical protein
LNVRERDDQELAELGWRVKITVMRASLPSVMPKPLHRVEIGRVGKQEDLRLALMLGEKLQDFGFLVIPESGASWGAKSAFGVGGTGFSCVDDWLRNS